MKAARTRIQIALVGKSLWIALIALIVLAAVPVPAHAEIGGESVSDWRRFRKRFSFHIQLVAVEQHERSLTVIISEPPPHAKTGEMLEILGASNHQIMSHPIGYDGWVKDLLIEFDADTPRPSADRFSRLHEYLFHTSHKAELLQIASLDDDFSVPHVQDISVPAEELYHWLIRKALPLVDHGNGTIDTLPHLLDSRRSGLYVSETPGFVVWLIPREKKLNLADYPIETRKWALDADLVLGAIASKHTLAIVGRERIASVIDLPPLRTEEIQLLAAVDKRELGQSYERNHPMAGPISGQGDWAPIFLSDELIDSEYGSLLNITDQLLKSWTMNGQITYWEFRYPQPLTWGFPRPLAKMIESNSLTFNWNTRGAGYTVPFGKYQVVAFHRTGALPVSYIPGGDGDDLKDSQFEVMQGHEQTGYDFFAGTGDPNLTRVVQYASLYTIFREFGIKASAPRAYQHAVSVASFQPMLVKVLADGARLHPNAYEFPQTGLVRRQPHPMSGQLWDWCGVRVTYTNNPLLSHSYCDVDYMKLLAHRLLEPKMGLTPSEQRRLDRVLARMSREREEGITSELASADLRLLGSIILTQKLQASSFFYQNVDRETAFIEFSREAATRTSPGWIRTPSLVLSNAGEVAVVGGHNLDSSVLKIRYNPELRPGQPRVITNRDGDRVLEVHPSDAYRASGMVRSVSRARTPDGAERIAGRLLRTQPVRPPRPPLAALYPAAQGPSVTSGATRTGYASAKRQVRTSGEFAQFRQVGSVRDGKALSFAEQHALDDVRAPWPEAVVVDITTHKRVRLLDGHPLGPLTAASMRDLANDIVSNEDRKKNRSPELVIDASGMDPSQARALRHNIELQLQRSGKDDRKVIVLQHGTQQTREMARRLIDNGDLKRARADVMDVQETAPGQYQVRQAMSISEHPGIKISLNASFKAKRGTFRRIMGKIRQAIRRAFSRLRPGDSPSSILRRIKDELDTAGIHVDDLELEVQDISFSENDSTPRPSAHERDIERPRGRQRIPHAA